VLSQILFLDLRGHLEAEERKGKQKGGREGKRKGRGKENTSSEINYWFGLVQYMDHLSSDDVTV